MTIEDIRLKQGDAYLSNPNLKRANTTFEWTQEQVIEFLKCKEDPVYFTKNYIKIVSTDEGLTNFNIWPFQERLISNFHKNRFNICKMPRQVGKALQLSTPIPTPTGWTTIGDIQVGDKILAPNGKPVSVTFKTEIMYDHKCYKIYFDNGEEIVADADHLWEVNSSYWRTGKKVITTDEIYKKYQNKPDNKRGKGVAGSFYIDAAKPACFEEKDLPIDPYLLGAWLGDGYASSGWMVSHKDDYEFYKTKFDIEREKEDGNSIRFKLRGLNEKLKDLNLIKNKHIPQSYLRSSIEQRMELLRGLMDTDGSITKTQSFEFYQKSYEFIQQFVELVSSLGFKARVRRKLIKDCYYYTVNFSSRDKVFNLPRKVELINFSQPSRPQNKRHYIQKIEETESVPVACIQVDSADHLFLCGKTFIPTHNTTTVVSYLLHYLVFNDHINIGILANKASTSREILGRLQLAYENLPKWMQQGVVSWNKGSVELENGSKILAASTSASAVRGMTFNIIFLDEFAFVPNHIADDFFASVYPTVSSGKSTKVIIVSCVTDDTFVLTPKGIRQMDEFIDYSKPEDPIKGYEVDDYLVYGHGGPKEGNILVNSGFHDTKIIYSPSSFVECSLRHPWFVCDNGKYDWKRTAELKGNEYVAIEYGHEVWDCDDTINAIDYKNYKSNIKSLNIDHITEDFAYLMGLYIAEGSSIKRVNSNETKYRGITITCGDDISSVLDRLNINYSCYDNLHYTISSTVLCDIMMSLGFDLSKTAKEKEIPKRLFRMSRNNIISLIQGIMDGDGSSQKNRGIVSITSTSKKLIQQLRALLNNFGVLSLYGEFTYKPTNIVKVESKQYRLELNFSMSKKYYETIGFRFERKQLNEQYLSCDISRDSYDIIPYSKDIILSLKDTHPEDYKKIVSYGLLKGNYKDNHHFGRKYLLRHKNFLLSLNNEVLNELLALVSENIKWESIKKIENSQNKVYDFSLEETGDKWCHSVLFNNIIGSNTPKGMNHFYRMWHDAERGKSDFVPTEVHWTEVPGRDDKWKEQIIANSSEEQFRAEYLCEFLGSVGTLINPSKLKTLVYGDPLKKNKGLDVYEDPKEEHNYVITVDVARGIDKDYSAFVVFDVTNFPYKVVAKYKNNQIKPMLFPSIIKEVADAYNKAWLLVEVNDIGDQVANILHFDLEYDNILMCAMRGRAGQIVGTGFSGKKSQLGVRMTAAVKKLGCSNLKTLVEDDKLLVTDYDIISELTTFIQKHNSFEAEEGCNDDLSMCMVIFSWLVAQPYFKEMTENDVRKRIYEEQKNQIEQDMAPFGFISNGIDNEVVIEDKEGDRWIPFNSNEFSEYTEYFYDEFYNQGPIKNQDWEVKTWNLDEYGDMSYMWDYR